MDYLSYTAVMYSMGQSNLVPVRLSPLLNTNIVDTKRYIAVHNNKRSTPMNQKKFLKISLFLMVLATFIYSQNLVNLSVGPMWPEQTRDSKNRTAWNIAIEYGRVFDQRLTIGVKSDILWNVTTEYNTTQTQQGNELLVKVAESSLFMFPLSVFLQFDPVPRLIVHPVIRVQGGLNMMNMSGSEYIEGQKESTSKETDGFYYGGIVKFGVDGVYDLGRTSALFVGGEYQIVKLQKQYEANTFLQNKKMHGFGLRFGASFMF